MKTPDTPGELIKRSQYYQINQRLEKAIARSREYELDNRNLRDLVDDLHEEIKTLQKNGSYSIEQVSLAWLFGLIVGALVTMAF